MILATPLIQSQTFDECFSRLQIHEGGYSSIPEDKGNWTSGKIGVGVLMGTKFGISAARYPFLDIKNLTLAEAKDIYFDDFWVKYQCELIPEEYRYFYFDCIVNHNPNAAGRIFQKALNRSGFSLKVDGLVGKNTYRALASGKLKIGKLRAERIHYYSWLVTRFPSNGVFLEGWINRTLAL